jgi:hypothetical protein
MDKTRLHKIFSNAFNQSDWIEVLKEVFGARQLLVQPNQIMLPSNDKAKSAFELGNFTTSDDRIIGLYKIELNENVQLERNKVGLRKLLRNVYQYDVDAAIIVFEQPACGTDRGEKWRLSFVSEIKVLNDEGEVVKQATEPKRYTYLLGEDEKVKTPSERLSKLAGKTLALNDILEAFSVEALNEEFYKIIAHYFYQLIGGKIGKGKKASDFGDGILQLPSLPKSNRLIYQEFAVRLIGRSIFSWFLKMKKSDAGKELLPEDLLSSKAVKNNENYYHTILERVFFQTLNTKMENRIEGLPNGCEQIPFLNGGLFEPDNDDFYKANRATGISENINTLKISDEWFFNLFSELEKYNFTIDENSVTDVEVSVDPEMLGRIFENLLAEIDPDSGETARKATGSFYTPREIVDYMATESLVQYLFNYELKNKNDKSDVENDELKDELRKLFKVDAPINNSSFNTHHLLEALDQIKILDPACGSGAFPMGVLQKIVMALQKLDPDAIWWKERQVKRITNQYVRKALREKLKDSSLEYARKIGIIQNSLYGVDIQPIAAEISKLRCFLSLVVDETINENKPNRGIEPLPNLEFKFVTADTLQKLPEQKQQFSIFDNLEELQKLEELRIEYLQSSGKKKENIKEEYIEVQAKMFKNELRLFADTQNRAYKLSSWNPFSHEKVDWFDPKWMFGVDSFDVVIGNPPYVEHKKLKHIAKNLKPHYDVYTGSSDLSVYFFEKGFNLLNPKGVLCYISTNKFFNTGYGRTLRKYLLNKDIERIINFEQVEVFKGVLVSSVIYISENNEPKENSEFKFIEFKNESNWKANFNDKLRERERKYFQNTYDDSEWVFLKGNEARLKKQIENSGTIVKDLEGIEIKRGVTTGFDPAFIIEKDKYIELYDDIIKPLLKGREIKKYSTMFSNQYLIFTRRGIDIDKHKSVKEYLLNYKVELTPRKNIGDTGRKPGVYNWYEIQDNTAYYQLFEDNKIIWPLTADRWGMTLDKKKHYLTSGGFFMVSKKYSLKILLAVLNSSLIEYYFKFIGVMTAGGAFTMKKATIEHLPICLPKVHKPFEILVDYILYINSLEKGQINPHVPNTHLVQPFEEVIDAMVMELYFEEDFKKVGIEFIKYAERDFKAIEHLKTEKEKIEVIHEAYQKLRQKDNEIRNNLKLMDIKLADIVMPIKTMK